MIKKSLNFFENQINEKKQKNKVITDISIFTIKELFVHFLCALFVQFLCLRDSFQNFSQLKRILSSGNKMFRADINFIKEKQFNWKISYI